METAFRESLVAKYCAYVIGSEGQFESSRAFDCDTDENAIVWAKQIAGLQPAELWSGKRLVERLILPLKKNGKERELVSSVRGSAMARLDERTIASMDLFSKKPAAVIAMRVDI